MLAVNAQQKTVTGTVTAADDGLPIIGATVQIKGSYTGVATDLDGKYSIAVPEGAVLVFRFVGKKTQEVTIGSANTYDVVLEADYLGLDEVVVVGYGTRLKSELTGSVAQVRATDIANTTQPSFESALQGKASGVYVQGGSGKLGQAIKVRVRGSASISADNQPLYVIDGMPVNTENIGTGGNEPTNPMADLNPADIETIQILKDASAAAIYGARAANGVVIITTKRGKEGKTAFNFTAQGGFSEPANRVGFLNREQYLQLVEEGFNNTVDLYGTVGDAYGWIGLDDSGTWEDILDILFPYWRDEDNPTDLTKGPDENWENNALRRGYAQQYDLSASGGNDKTRFYASLGWANQESILIKNDFDRISARLTLDHQASEFVSFGLSLNPVRSRSFRVANDNAFATPLQMVALAPLDPAYFPGTDELNDWTQYENGLIPAKYNNFNALIYRNIGNVFAQFNLMEGLSFRTEFGADQTNQKERGYWGRLTNDGGPYGSAEERTVMLLNYTTNNYLSYDKVFGQLGLNLVGGMTYQESYIETQFNGAENFPSDHFRRITSGAEPSSMSGSGTGYSFVSYFLRSNIKVADKYLFTLSGRYDGSSRFGKDNRYGFFPAASAAWIISEESFMENLSFLSFLKLRGSWGITGNAEIGNFASRGLYSASNYAGYSGLVPTGLPWSDLKWETTQQINFGIDFGFFNNRLTGEIDYYIKNTSDLLLSKNVPATSGFTTIVQNVGDLENSGWEFMINSVNVTGPLTWSTRFNIAFNKNKDTNLNGEIIDLGNWRAMEGQPIGIFWMPVYAGVDPDNGDALFYTDDTRTETTLNLSAADFQVAGDPNPDFVGGMTNTLTWKGIDFGFTFQFVYGNEIFNGGRQWQADGLSWTDNQTVEFFENYWKEPGDDAKYPQPRFLEGNGYGISSMLLFDGSYLRLKDMTLGYTIKSPVLNKYGLTSTRVFVKALNLLTFTEYPGWDPETNYVGTGVSAQTYNLRQGYDFYTAPQPRTITFGLQLGF